MEVTIPLSTREEALAVFGLGDRNLKLLRDALGVRVTARNDFVRFEGESAAVASRILESLVGLVRSGGVPPEDFVEREIARATGAPRPVAEASLSTGGERAAAGAAPPALDAPVRSAHAPDVPSASGPGGLPPSPAAEPPRPASAGGAPDLPPAAPAAPAPPALPAAAGAGSAAAPQRAPALEVPPRHPVPVRALTSAEERFVSSLARSPGQAGYLADMLRDEIVFSVGPAGTGKTFLAVNIAVHFLREGEIRRLILCRPAVEAGEKLGFLPGDFHDKINPYLRPLYDSLNDVLGFEQVKRYLEREIIEIIPLAYMRGRTLNNAFIILDEAQNTTVSQMKMFLTRMGANSRIVVNGDPTQVDLPSGQPSGLIHAQQVIRDIRGISWAPLGRSDIVRHPLVQRIVEAYEAEPKSDRPDLTS